MAGSAVAVNTGAFSNATVHRDVTVSTAAAQAVLRLDPDSGLPNSDDAVADADGVLAIDISEDSDNVGGKGLSPDTKTLTGERYPIENRDVETVEVSPLRPFAPA